MVLDNKTKKLIALGASIAVNCHSCLQHHVKVAFASGLEKKEISTALNIGKLVKRNTESEMDILLANLLQDTSINTNPINDNCGNDGCDCN